MESIWEQLVDGEQMHDQNYIGFFFSKKNVVFWTSEMVQALTALPDESENLSSIPVTHKVEEETSLPRIVI